MLAVTFLKRLATLGCVRVPEEIIEVVAFSFQSVLSV